MQFSWPYYQFHTVWNKFKLTHFAWTVLCRKQCIITDITEPSSVTNTSGTTDHGCLTDKIWHRLQWPREALWFLGFSVPPISLPPGVEVKLKDFSKRCQTIFYFNRQCFFVFVFLLRKNQLDLTSKMKPFIFDLKLKFNTKTKNKESKEQTLVYWLNRKQINF